MFQKIIMRAGVCIFSAATVTTALPIHAMAADYTAKELRALGLSSDWRNGRGVITKGPDGKVIYLYGQVQPTVVCAPLQVCDVELQSGEAVRNVLAGDTVRWKVDPATSGGPSGNTVHLIIKPTEPWLSTSMVVTTSRRTYQIKMKSDSHHYMARVGFDYPEDIQAKFETANRQLEASIIPGAGVPAENLDFRYHIHGQARWRPTRVYSDGTKTYIQFPSGIASTDAPVIYLTSGRQNQIVNYRLKGSLMIVDYTIDQAVLVSGVGRHQQKVRINKGG